MVIGICPRNITAVTWWPQCYSQLYSISSALALQHMHRHGHEDPDLLNSTSLWHCSADSSCGIQRFSCHSCCALNVWIHKATACAHTFCCCFRTLQHACCCHQFSTHGWPGILKVRCIMIVPGRVIPVRSPLATSSHFV